jgi:phage terminase small subunit
MSKNDLHNSPETPPKKRGRPKGSVKKKEKGLTPRQQRFRDEYMVDLNGTQAAIRAGYSPKCARETASELLTNPVIKAAIDQAMKELSERTGVTAERVIKELALIGFANMQDFVTIDESGMIQANMLDTLPEGSSRVIKKVKEKRVIRTTKGTVDNPDGDQILDATYEFELCDKVKSLDLLARHLGILHDKNEHTGKDGGPLTVELVEFVVGGDGKVANTK